MTSRIRNAFAVAALLVVGGGCDTGPDLEPVGAAPSPAVVATVREAARPLSGADDDFAALVEQIGDARVVLLGEATHGTHEFYEARARITQRLIAEHGFTAVAVEADWPEAAPVNAYVRGMGGASTATEALSAFEGFPTWMWRNADVLALVEWLHDYNASTASEGARVGFYGIDLQTLGPAIEGVTRFLDQVDPEAAARARERYTCFSPYEDDPAGYGESVTYGSMPGCASQAAEQVQEFATNQAAWTSRGGAEAFFSAAQNARLVQGAERYFRSQFDYGVSSWNLRDTYMADVVGTLLSRSGGPPARVVVWAHNSHVGDARATERAEYGELNLGQLVRQQWGEDAVLVGFTTYSGSVVAASEWGGAPQVKAVRPALVGSYEHLFHDVGIPAFYLPLQGAVADALRPPRLERAIGVLYLPETERTSHYFQAVLPEQFDAVLHFDETRAVGPLDPLGAAPRDGATAGLRRVPVGNALRLGDLSL
ncbi:MAG TPA: erythromycin esterase family protein [Rubricoccaceae bacterium]|jgi:erythromycin esterase-like protein